MKKKKKINTLNGNFREAEKELPLDLNGRCLLEEALQRSLASLILIEIFSSRSHASLSWPLNSSGVGD